MVSWFDFVCFQSFVLIRCSGTLNPCAAEASLKAQERTMWLARRSKTLREQVRALLVFVLRWSRSPVPQRRIVSRC